MTIHPTTGVISGTLTYRSAGTYHPTITVTDNTAGGPFGDNASQTFTWTVSNTDTIPTLPHQPNRTSAEGESVDVQLTGAGDADGDTLTWSATGLPPDLSISATGRVTGTLTYTSAGSHTVTITVTDNTPGGPGGDSANRTFTWTVTHTDTTPTLEPQPDRENYEGQTVNVLLTGAADVDGDPLTWSAAGLPPGLRISAAGRISGIIANGAAVGSPYTVTVTDPDGGASAADSGGDLPHAPSFSASSPNE